MCFSVCVLVALVIQHAKRMLCIMLSSVTSLAAPYFQNYLISGTVFLKQNVEHKLCVLIFLRIVSEIFLILRRIQRDFIIKVGTSPCKVPVILVGFFDGFSKKKKVKYQISSKSVPL
jgi:hypothetical protein